MNFLTFFIGIVVLFIVLKILTLPMKIIIKFLINAAVRWNCAICARLTWRSDFQLHGFQL